jgi:phosphoglycolate phosphatase-like HAD superfamily hydrolase
MTTLMPYTNDAVVCFDLDGPILDVSERYYRLYSDLLTRQGSAVLTKSSYWEHKRSGRGEDEILAQTGSQNCVERYAAERLGRIEAVEYLAYDVIWGGLREALLALARRQRLILVTLRRSRPSLEWQLRQLRINQVFEAVLSAPPGGSTEANARVKTTLVQDAIGSRTASGWLVGDTKTDLLAGRALGLETVAVTFGICTRQRLLSSLPTLVLESPDQLCHWTERTGRGVE